jgi:hypothetical protein
VLIGVSLVSEYGLKVRNGIVSDEKVVIRLTRKQKPHVYRFTLKALYLLPSRAKRTVRASN